MAWISVQIYRSYFFAATGRQPTIEDMIAWLRQEINAPRPTGRQPTIEDMIAWLRQEINAPRLLWS